MTYHNEDFQPCSRRDRLVKVDREGNRSPLFRCTEQNADHYFEEVTPDICEACPLRKVVTLASIAKHEYTPPLVEDYAEVQSRKADLSKDDPLYLPCFDRQLVEVPACCGSMQELRVCNSVDCFRMGSQVTPEMCRECPNRRT